jgi:preprotein translocase subunit SecF
MRDILNFKNKVVDFVGMFPLFTTLSTLAFIGSVVLLMTKGLNYGVDFKGGAEVQVKFAQSVDIGTLRNTLENNQVNVSSVQSIGDAINNEFLIKIAATSEDINVLTEGVVKVLNSQMGDKGVDIRRTEIVGPKAGEQLRSSGIWAMIWSVIGIMVYVGLRFDIKYAPGAAISLLHDAIITLGIFVLTGKEFNLQILGAILALIGYSINDTVVIYDRIREHEQGSQRAPIKQLINQGLTETLSRTFLTAGTTFTVCLVMFLFGGGVIHDFFFTLWVGIIIGTYSSLFVATPLVLLLYKLTTNRAYSKKAS